jgi:hypothetical protein
MPRLSAYVVAESGADFTCGIANLTTRSLFLETDARLLFRERVSVTFFSVEVSGEVALVSEAPLGVVVVFDATEDVKKRIAAHMAHVTTISDGTVRDASLNGKPRPPTTAPAGAPVLEESSATERHLFDGFDETFDTIGEETGNTLRRGLTSHAAARPMSSPRGVPIAPAPTKPDLPNPIAEGPIHQPQRRAQETRLDNAVVNQRRGRSGRERDITDLDPSSLLDGS